MTILVTGAAGFIGSAVCKRLLRDGHVVAGIDSLVTTYEPQLKLARLQNVENFAQTRISSGASAVKFAFTKLDLADRVDLSKYFAELKPTRVINLAAHAGVRRSIEDPLPYIDSNIVGFTNLLECCRHYPVEHLVYASSSSVYGANTNLPFSVHNPADHPLSLYAATKRANELLAHTYSHLFKLPATGLRFFTVYGPWGRPDMALFLFTKAMLAGEHINIFNNGEHQRDFTYIDDIVDGIVKVVAKPPVGNSAWSGKQPDIGTSRAPWRIYNIGNNNPVSLLEYVAALEAALGMTAKKNMLPLQPGDVPATWSDISDLVVDVGYAAHTPVREGVAKFVAWYRDYYGV